MRNLKTKCPHCKKQTPVTGPPDPGPTFVEPSVCDHGDQMFQFCWDDVRQTRRRTNRRTTAKAA